MDEPWRIEMLGWLRATRRDQVVSSFRSHNIGSLLAFLAYYSRSHPRDELVELHWPECAPQVGRNNLRVALSLLRHQLEPPGVPSGHVILADRSTVRLNPEAYVTDVGLFGAACSAVRSPRVHAGPAAAEPPSRSDGAERLRRLPEAIELYRGELLPGFFERWVLQERQWLVERYLHALSQAVEQFVEAGELESAIRYAQRAVHADPLQEEAQRTLMRLYAAAGRPAAGLRQYRELERVLSQELAAAPDLATAALARELEQMTAARPRPAAAGGAPSPAAGETAALDRLEPVGGAVPVDSAFYVVRPPDVELRSAIARQDSIVLVKGARQMGKTSLLARGLQQAREAGAMVVLTDLQTLNSAHLESAEVLLLTLAQWIGGQLGLEGMPDESWNTRCAPNISFELYLRRQVLNRISAPIVWGLDGVDRLFTSGAGSELFALFRSWHDRRSLEPTGPFSRLTLAIAYATEAHLFITDLNQSPFNVGTRLTLEDFTLEQVGDLNRRYRSPLVDEELARFFSLLSGQPYLVRRALHEMATRGLELAGLEAQADQDRGIFGDHLRGIRGLLSQDPELCDVMRVVLQGQPCPSEESFYRLRSAGLLVGDSPREVRPRCQLYARYLERHLP